MEKMLLAASLALTVVGLTACAEETTNNVTETTGMTIVEKGAKMPNCTADNAGEMVYSIDSAAAFVCADGKWQSLKGEKGEQGIQGEQGPKGGDSEGTAGEAGKSCEGKLNADGSITITCGKTTIGTIKNGEGCSAKDNSKGVVTVTCGKDKFSLYKAMCGSVAYDPETQLCDTRNNKAYRFVTIGTQTWMAENLNYQTATGSYCQSGDEWCDDFGRYYTWAAAIDSAALYDDGNGVDCGYGKACALPDTVRGVCPDGWHLPKRTEWETLIVTADSTITQYNDANVAGKRLKVAEEDWWEPYSGITYEDTYGFSALPVGSRDDENGFFSSPKFSAIFWSTTPNGMEYAYYMKLNYKTNSAVLNFENKKNAFSVRCVRDSE